MLGGLNSGNVESTNQVEGFIYKQLFSYSNTSFHEFQNVYLKGKIKNVQFFWRRN